MLNYLGLGVDGRLQFRNLDSHRLNSFKMRVYLPCLTFRNGLIPDIDPPLHRLSSVMHISRCTHGLERRIKTKCKQHLSLNNYESTRTDNNFWGGSGQQAARQVPRW